MLIKPQKLWNFQLDYILNHNQRNSEQLYIFLTCKSIHTRVIHILSTFEGFKSDPFIPSIVSFHEKITRKFFFNSLRLGVPQISQKSEILSNFGIFVMLSIALKVLFDRKLW